MRWVHGALTLTIVCAVARAAQCPPTCNCTATQLSCTAIIPDGLRLTRAALADYGPILEITWIDSSIHSLEQDLFQNLTQLVLLDLSRNQLTRTEPGLFSGLRHLTKLNISRNSLEDIPPYSFTDLVSLEVLDVSHNSLHVIPFHVFAPMTRLHYLDISHNRIVTFQNHYFKPNKQLKSLFLNNNSLVKITSNALVDLRELETLDLSSNGLEYLPKYMFDSFDRLRRLNISTNHIQNISKEAFKNLHTLEWLDFGGNKIKTLPTGVFLHNDNLSTLYLDNTYINVLHNTDLQGLSNLQHLYLRNNYQLKEIEMYAFQNTPTITHLDISGNFLTFLPTSIKSLENLTELKINNNPWACDCRMEWFLHWVEQNRSIAMSDLRCNQGYRDDMLQVLKHADCKPPSLVRSSPMGLYMLRGDAILECKFSGNPAPSIAWVTPTRNVYHWNPEPLIQDIFTKHGAAHDQYQNAITDDRLRVLENGSLLITDIHREDSGTYLCFATNPKANISAEVILNIDPATMYEIKMYSLLFGAVCAAAFLALTLAVQFLRYIFQW